MMTDELNMIRIATVKFQTAGRQYDFNAQGLDLEPGQSVVVETDRGRALATVVDHPRDIEPDQAPDGLKSILRIASSDDLAMANNNAAREADAFRYCQARVKERQMDMKLVRAEYAFDGSKIIFYFTADGRVDFRELVKDLARYFHTRIEMRQIGVRDEAKLVGGLGVCGRELCCCTYLTEFSPVSVKMAKEQGLALNPNKISGQCGRLLCCLSYEYETYCSLKKGMPKCGKRVHWNDKEWTVASQNVICSKLSLKSEDGANCTITMAEFESGSPATPPTEPDAEDKSGQKKPQAKRPAPGRESSSTNRRRPTRQKPSEGQTKPAKDASPSSGKPESGKPASDKDKPRSARDSEQDDQSATKKRRRRRPRGRRRSKQQKPQGGDKS
jgi:cell fate regulator YaaT (PSP1 superfamily)